MKSLSVVTLLSVATLCSGSTSLLRANNDNDDNRKLQGPCGDTITPETLALLGLTEEDCLSMVGDSNKGGDSCEAIECPLSCPEGVQCCLVPGYDFRCGHPKALSAQFNIAEVNIKVLCDKEIALGSP